MKAEVMKIKEIVKIIELEPLYPKGNSEEQVIFRIEIVQDSDKAGYYPMVWLKESYRLQPTFSQDDKGTLNGSISDETILKEEVSLGFDRIKGASVDEVLDKVLKSISELCDLPDET